MQLKIAINGFGRIGRCQVRSLQERKNEDLKVVEPEELERELVARRATRAARQSPQTASARASTSLPAGESEDGGSYASDRTPRAVRSEDTRFAECHSPLDAPVKWALLASAGGFQATAMAIALADGPALYPIFFATLTGTLFGVVVNLVAPKDRAGRASKLILQLIQNLRR